MPAALRCRRSRNCSIENIGSSFQKLTVERKHMRIRSLICFPDNKTADLFGFQIRDSFFHPLRRLPADSKQHRIFSMRNADRFVCGKIPGIPDMREGCFRRRANGCRIKNPRRSKRFRLPVCQILIGFIRQLCADCRERPNQPPFIFVSAIHSPDRIKNSLCFLHRTELPKRLIVKIRRRLFCTDRKTRIRILTIKHPVFFYKLAGGL